MRSENGVFVTGLGGEGSMENIYFENINLRIDKFGMYSHPSRDYRPSYIGIVPEDKVDAIYVEHAKNVVLKNTKVFFVWKDKERFWNTCLGWDNSSSVVVDDNFVCNAPGHL